MLKPKIIIDDLILNTSNTYTWCNKWISEYESPWGIIEKFRYANTLSSGNLFDIFGTDSTKIKKIKNRSQRERDLITLYGFDQNVVKSILGIDLHNVNKSYYEKDFGIDLEQNYMHKLIRNTIFYCPECFKIGYHSIWFQNSLVYKCPFHDIALEERCPVCNSAIPYEIDKKSVRHPFKCFCGYSYFNESTKCYFSDIWEIHKTLKIKSSELLQWNTINNEHLENLKLTYFNNKNTNSGIFRLVISVISDCQDNNVKSTVEHYKITSVFSINKIKNTYGEKLYNLKIHDKKIRNLKDLKRLIPNKTLDLKYKEFYREMYKSYRVILSSISRYVRKKVIYKHKKCVNKLIKNSTILYNKNTEICPYAYAYIMWRKSIGNSLVSNLFKNDSKNKDINYTIAPDNSLMLDLFSDWKSRFGQDIFNNVVVCRWVLYKVMAHVFISHYYNWLNVVKALQRSELDWSLYFEYEEIPAYVVRYLDSEKPYMEFHWTGKYKEINSIPKTRLNEESKEIEKNLRIKR